MLSETSADYVVENTDGRGQKYYGVYSFNELIVLWLLIWSVHKNPSFNDCVDYDWVNK